MSSGLGELGRFSEPALYILVSLAGGPRHGYAMMLDIEELSGARPGPGTLYGALARLESRGWITALPAEERRKPYALTAAGLAVLEARLAELQALARHGRQRLEAAR
jgi:DNA-binding PadR family transcriptional regulator